MVIVSDFVSNQPKSNKEQPTMNNVSISHPLGRIFRALDQDVAFPPSPSVAGFRVDIEEADKEYRIRADLPGVKKEDITVSVEDNVLSIGAKFQSEHEESDGKRVHTERVSGEYSRGFRLSRDIESDKIDAQVKDGVLTLRLPKSGAAARRSVAVK